MTGQETLKQQAENNPEKYQATFYPNGSIKQFVEKDQYVQYHSGPNPNKSFYTRKITDFYDNGSKRLERVWTPQRRGRNEFIKQSRYSQFEKGEEVLRETSDKQSTDTFNYKTGVKTVKPTTEETTAPISITNKITNNKKSQILMSQQEITKGEGFKLVGRSASGTKVWYNDVTEKTVASNTKPSEKVLRSVYRTDKGLKILETPVEKKEKKKLNNFDITGAKFNPVVQNKTNNILSDDLLNTTVKTSFFSSKQETNNFSPVDSLNYYFPVKPNINLKVNPVDSVEATKNTIFSIPLKQGTSNQKTPKLKAFIEPKINYKDVLSSGKLTKTALMSNVDTSLKTSKAKQVLSEGIPITRPSTMILSKITGNKIKADAAFSLVGEYDAKRSLNQGTITAQDRQDYNVFEELKGELQKQTTKGALIEQGNIAASTLTVFGIGKAVSAVSKIPAVSKVITKPFVSKGLSFSGKALKYAYFGTETYNVADSFNKMNTGNFETGAAKLSDVAGRLVGFNLGSRLLSVTGQSIKAGVVQQKTIRITNNNQITDIGKSNIKSVINGIKIEGFGTQIQRTVEGSTKARGVIELRIADKTVLLGKTRGAGKIIVKDNEASSFSLNKLITTKGTTNTIDFSKTVFKDNYASETLGFSFKSTNGIKDLKLLNSYFSRSDSISSIQKGKLNFEYIKTGKIIVGSKEAKIISESFTNTPKRTFNTNSGSVLKFDSGTNDITSNILSKEFKTIQDNIINNNKLLSKIKFNIITKEPKTKQPTNIITKQPIIKNKVVFKELIVSDSKIKQESKQPTNIITKQPIIKNKAVFKELIVSDSKIKQESKQPTTIKGQTNSNIRSEQIITPITEQFIINDIKGKSKTNSKSLIKIDTVSNQTSNNKTRQQQRQDLFNIPLFVNSQPIFKPKETIKPKPPIRIPSFSFSLPKFNSNNSAFDVFVRRKGKFKIVNSGLNRSDALSFGGFFVDTTSAATFKIKKSGKSVSKSFNKVFDKANFYQKGNLFIEKRSKRISTGGEKKEITLKGLQTISTKKILGGLKNVF